MVHCVIAAIDVSVLVNVVVGVRSLVDDYFTDILDGGLINFSDTFILFITKFKASVILLTLLLLLPSLFSLSLVISVCCCSFVLSFVIISSRLCVIACFFNILFVYHFSLFHGNSCLFALMSLHSVNISLYAW